MGYKSTGYVANVLSGARPVPLKKIGEWEKALRVEGEEAERLVYLAQLACTPPELRRYVQRLVAENSKLRDELANK